MSFVPDNSAAYAAYKAQLANVAGSDVEAFKDHIIKFFGAKSGLWVRGYRCGSHERGQRCEAINQSCEAHVLGCESKPFADTNFTTVMGFAARALTMQLEATRMPLLRSPKSYGRPSKPQCSRFRRRKTSAT